MISFILIKHGEWTSMRHRRILLLPNLLIVGVIFFQVPPILGRDPPQFEAFSFTADPVNRSGPRPEPFAPFSFVAGETIRTGVSAAQSETVVDDDMTIPEATFVDFSFTADAISRNGPRFAAFSFVTEEIVSTGNPAAMPAATDPAIEDPGFGTTFTAFSFTADAISRNGPRFAAFSFVTEEVVRTGTAAAIPATTNLDIGDPGSGTTFTAFSFTADAVGRSGPRIEPFAAFSFRASEVARNGAVERDRIRHPSRQRRIDSKR